MKKIFTILLVFISLATVAQNTHTQSNANTNEQFQGAVEAKKGFINGYYTDTAAANFSWIKDKPFAQIATDSGTVWIRNNTATKWNKSGGSGAINQSYALTNGLTSTGGIALVDSTLTIEDTIRYTINGTDYVQTTPSIFTINSADSGYYRRDLIYADADGLHKLVGEPNTSIAVVPNLPFNAVVVTIVDIYGDHVITPTPVIIGVIPTWEQTMLQGNTTNEAAIINNNSQSPIQVYRDANSPAYLYFKNSNPGSWAGTGFRFNNDAPSSPYNEHSGNFLQLYMGSIANDLVANGGIIRVNSSGGLTLSVDTGRIRFMRGFPFSSNPWEELGSFEHDGRFRLDYYKNNSNGDSVLSTDENGLLVMKKLTDSVDVSFLKGDKIDTSHLPISNIYIQQAGAGETHIVRAADDTTLSVTTLKNSTDITISKNPDSSAVFNFTNPHYTKDQVDSIAATLSGGGGTIDTSGAFLIDVDSVAANTLRFYKGAGHKDFVFTGVDTSHLSDRINLKFNTTDTTGKWFSWGFKRNDSVFLCKNTTCIFIFKDSSGGGGGGGAGVDTAFIKLYSNGRATPANYKGLFLGDSTNMASAPLIFSGVQNTTLRYYWRMRGDGSGANGLFNIDYSVDSIAWTNVFQLNRQGAINMLGSSPSLTTTSYVSAAQFAGAKLNIIGPNGFTVLGASRVPNPLAMFELQGDSTRGSLGVRVSTFQKLKMTGSVYSGTILSGGTGNTNGVGVSRVFTDSIGNTGNAFVTISGGILTAFTSQPYLTSGTSFIRGSTLSCTNCGGSGIQYQITKLTGDTATSLQLSDTSIHAPQHFIGNVDGYGDAWQNGYSTNSASTHIQYGNDYVFTGSTATYTLPSVHSSILGRTNSIRIVNMGSGTITVNSYSGGNDIIAKSSITPVATISIVSGASAEIMPIGTYFKVLYNN